MKFIQDSNSLNFLVNKFYDLERSLSIFQILNIRDSVYNKFVCWKEIPELSSMGTILKFLLIEFGR